MFSGKYDNSFSSIFSDVDAKVSGTLEIFTLFELRLNFIIDTFLDLAQNLMIDEIMVTF